jgi:4-hydroxy-tetrahydrodipicolinate synthase
MNKHIFEGTGVALVTPFKQNGNIDFESLTKIVNHVIDGGVDYLVVMGTTGESVVLSLSEKKDITNHVLDINNGRLRVVLGIGGNNTSAVVKQIESTDLTNISGLLSVSPYYNKPSQHGIYAHYEAVAKASPLPVILYNVPGRTGSTISPETTLNLAAAFENIVATKEASGNLDAITRIIMNKPDGFAVVSGDDALSLPLISLGANGVISVIANAYPGKMSSLINNSINGDFVSARAIHYQLVDMIAAIFQDGNPGGIKCVLKQMGLAEECLRLPLVPVSDETRERIKELAGKIG